MARLSLQDRTTEMIVGVLLAVTFRGGAHAVADHPTILTLVLVSLGGTFAWALVDAVVSLMESKGARLRFAAYAADVRDGKRGAPEFEGLGQHLDAAGRDAVAPALAQAVARMPPPPTHLSRGDFLDAAAVLAAVMVAGLPPLVPFLLPIDIEVAFHSSNAVAGLLLFGIGFAWGRGHGIPPWRAGLAMVALGLFLVLTMLALE